MKKKKINLLTNKIITQVLMSWNYMENGMFNQVNIEKIETEEENRPPYRKEHMFL